MSRFRSAAVALAALALVSTAVFAAGLFPGFPIVGGASYCSSQSTSGVPGTTAACNVTVPAGPTILTGNELIPADTALPSGQQPQTVLLSMASIGSGPYQYVAPADAASTTVLATTRQLILDPAGTLTTSTIVLPPATALIDNQKFSVSSSKTITGLTVTAGSGTTVSNAPTALTISTTGSYGYSWLYRSANTTWYRTQ